MLIPIVGKTEEEAKAKFADYQQYISTEGALALFGGWTGIDLSGYTKDQEIQFIENDAIRSALENFTKIHDDRPSTVEDVIQAIGIGGIGRAIVGTPEQIADEMEKWVDVAGVDGFNIAYAITPEHLRILLSMLFQCFKKEGVFLRNIQA